MSSLNETHPSPDDLIAFSAGKFDAGLTTDTILQHLETCDACRKIVAGLSGSGFQDRLNEARKSSSTFSSGKSKSATSPKPSERAKSPSSATASLEAELANNPDYEGLVELGRGGMGVVYKVHNKLTGRDEVLKVMGKEIMSRPGAEERFRREIQSAARLDHTNIVRAYTARSYGEWLVFSMEFVQGDDLGKYVSSQGPLKLLNACYYVLQVANGLQHAHEKGMVHRDIKPANLILHREGKKHTVKILDFGLAKMMFESGQTADGMMLGTPDYIAPEQIVDAKSADIRADIYSLGCTLHFLLTGSAPFSASSLYELLRKHKEERAPMLNRVRPDVPEELAEVVARMMAKDPKQRFQTPAEVAKAVGAFTKPGTAPSAPRTDLAQSTGKVPLPLPPPLPDKLAGIWSEKTRVPDARIDPPLADAKTAPRSPVKNKRGKRKSSLQGSDGRAPAKASRRKRPQSGIPVWVWPVAGGGGLLFLLLTSDFDPTEPEQVVAGGGGLLFLLLMSCWISFLFREKSSERMIEYEPLPTNPNMRIDDSDDP